jgi:hypothetical protein
MSGWPGSSKEQRKAVIRVLYFIKRALRLPRSSGLGYFRRAEPLAKVVYG